MVNEQQKGKAPKGTSLIVKNNAAFAFQLSERNVHETVMRLLASARMCQTQYEWNLPIVEKVCLSSFRQQSSAKDVEFLGQTSGWTHERVTVHVEEERQRISQWESSRVDRNIIATPNAPTCADRDPINTLWAEDDAKKAAWQWAKKLNIIRGTCF